MNRYPGDIPFELFEEDFNKLCDVGVIPALAEAGIKEVQRLYRHCTATVQRLLILSTVDTVETVQRLQIIAYNVPYPQPHA